MFHSTLTGDKSITNETSAVDHAQWLQEQYQIHHARTMRWRNSKQSDYDVVIQPSPWYAAAKTYDHGWYLNGVAHGDVGTTPSTVPYITLSTKKIRTEPSSPNVNDSVPYCLDAGTGVEGSIIKVSACYPNENPNENRDVFQHFVLNKDGSLQFYDISSSSALCVTNHDPQFLSPGAANSAKYLSLQKCVREVEQNWAYHGVAPGEDDTSGNMEFGDVEYYLGIVKHV